MTEEELKRNITETIDDQLNHNLELICSSNYLADRILTLIRTSGLFMDTDMVKGLMFEKCAKCERKDWKSPEEVTQLEADLDGFKHGSL